MEIDHRDLTAPTLKARPFNDPDWIGSSRRLSNLLIKDGQRIGPLARTDGLLCYLRD